MATFTASILVGNGHPNDGGIHPIDVLYLSENSRLAWIMRRASNHSLLRQEMVWVSTVDHSIEDAIFMIAYVLLRHEGIVALVDEFNKDFNPARANLYNDFTDEQREQIYARLNAVENFPKMIVSAYKDSHLLDQVQRLPGLSDGDIEICKPVYSRIYDHWPGQTIEKSDRR